MNGELFLTAYTLLSQAAIGLIVMVWFAGLFSERELDSGRAYRIFLAAVIASAAAMGISAMHLGSPLRAMNSLGNLGTSWLSREILFTNLFFLSALYGVYLSRKGAPVKLPLAAGSLLGMVCVVCQAAIYAHAAFPAWGNGHAYAAFFTSTFLTGAFLAAFFLLRGEAPAADSQRGLLICALTAAAALIAAAGFYAIFPASLLESGAAGHKSLALFGDYALLMALRWLFGGAAVAGLAMAAYRRAAGGGLMLFILLAILGEASNRFIFYSIAAGAGL